MHPQDRLFCEIAVQLQLLTREQASRCVHAQQREAVGQSAATVALALGYLDQEAVDRVFQQQQRVLDRRREARAASRAQREAESRAAAGLPAAATPEHSPVSRPPRQAGVSGLSQARRDATPEPASASEPASDGQPRYAAGTWSEARQSTDDPRETIDERPPLRGSLHGRSRGQTGGARSDALSGRESAPLFANADSKPAPPTASSPASARSASVRGTLLETSGMEQKRRELQSSPGMSARPRPSGRDWRNPSRPPPASESGLETPLSRRAPGSASTRASAQTFRSLSSGPPAAAQGAGAPSVSTAPTSLTTTPRSARPSSRASGAAARGGSAAPRGPGPQVRRRVRAPEHDAPGYIDRVLDVCVQHGASDFHLHPDALPRLRIDTALQSMAADAPVPAKAVERILGEVLDDAQRMQLSLDGELRRVYESPSSGVRARVHAYVSERGTHLQLHLLPQEVPSPEQLGLGEALSVLEERPYGIVMCSGPAGSGVTTTLWSLCQALAMRRARHVVALESPLEMKLRAGMGLFEQREVGKHVESYAQGIAWALSEGADVIVVSDMLAPGALEASLGATSARCLVLGGAKASSSVRALSRLLGDVDSDAARLRGQLAYGLRLLLHQRLLPRSSETGCVAALEAWLGGAELSQLIRQGDLRGLCDALRAPGDAGRFSLRDALSGLVRGAVISPAVMRATLGIDHAFLES